MWIKNCNDQATVINVQHYSSISIVQEEDDFLIYAFFPNGDADLILRTKDGSLAATAFRQIELYLGSKTIRLPEVKDE
jgi:hypothetical protein